MAGLSFQLVRDWRLPVPDDRKPMIPFDLRHAIRGDDLYAEMKRIAHRYRYWGWRGKLRWLRDKLLNRDTSIPELPVRDRANRPR